MLNLSTTQIYKALSDPTRLRCIALLVNQGELCVCELTYALELAQPKISHHLANLRKAGLVADRKEGLWIYYRIHPDLPKWVNEMLEVSINGFKKQPPFNSDLIRLLSMPDRPDSQCST